MQAGCLALLSGILIHVCVTVCSYTKAVICSCEYMPLAGYAIARGGHKSSKPCRRPDPKAPEQDAAVRAGHRIEVGGAGGIRPPLGLARVAGTVRVEADVAPALVVRHVTDADVDVWCDGQVSKTEFAKWYQDNFGRDPNGKEWKQFHDADKDDNGSVSAVEIAASLATKEKKKFCACCCYSPKLSLEYQIAFGHTSAASSSSSVTGGMGRTIHVGGLEGEELEDEAKLEKLFSRFGTVVALTLRTRREGKKVSWALVSFHTAEEASRALDGVQYLSPQHELVARSVDEEQVVHSTGAMGEVMRQHVKGRLQGFDLNLAEIYRQKAAAATEKMRAADRKLQLMRRNMHTLETYLDAVYKKYGSGSEKERGPLTVPVMEEEEKVLFA